MRIMNRKELDSFKKKHPQSIKPLTGWEIVINDTDYTSFNHLKMTFPAADYLSAGYTVFNISGNKYRLVAEIDYSFKTVEIKIVWTHSEYSQSKNAAALRRGDL